MDSLDSYGVTSGDTIDIQTMGVRKTITPRVSQVIGQFDFPPIAVNKRISVENFMQKIVDTGLTLDDPNKLRFVYTYIIYTHVVCVHIYMNTNQMCCVCVCVVFI